MKFLFVALGLSFCVFQNCSPFQPSDIGGIYNYSAAPDVYKDVKLVRVETDEHERENYVFDIAMAYAHNPDGEVNYRVSFSTLDIPGVCADADGAARGDTKHFRVNCLIPVTDDLYVQLTVVGPGGEVDETQYRF